MARVALSSNPAILRREIRHYQRKLHRARAGAQVARYRRAIELRVARLNAAQQRRDSIT